MPPGHVSLALHWGTATLEKREEEATAVPVGASPWLFELCRRASRAIFARPQLSASPEVRSRAAGSQEGL